MCQLLRRPFLRQLGLVKGSDGEKREKVMGLQFLRELMRAYYDYHYYADIKGEKLDVEGLGIEDEAK